MPKFVNRKGENCSSAICLDVLHLSVIQELARPWAPLLQFQEVRHLQRIWITFELGTICATINMKINNPKAGSEAGRRLGPCFSTKGREVLP